MRWLCSFVSHSVWMGKQAIRLLREPLIQPEPLSDEERSHRDLYPHYSGRNHPWQR